MLRILCFVAFGKPWVLLPRNSGPPQEGASSSSSGGSSSCSSAAAAAASSSSSTGSPSLIPLQGNAGLRDEYLILVRKQLSHPIPKYKMMGILALKSIVAHLGG